MDLVKRTMQSMRVIVLFTSICLMNGCSWTTNSPTSLRYQSFADVGPNLDMTVMLTSLAHRRVQERSLHDLIEETVQKFPNGFAPSLVSGHRLELITIKKDGREVKLAGLGNVTVEQGDLFRRLVGELLRVGLDEQRERGHQPVSK